MRLLVPISTLLGTAAITLALCGSRPADDAGVPMRPLVPAEMRGCQGCAKQNCTDTGQGKIIINQEPTVQNGQCDDDPAGGDCKKVWCPLSGTLKITNNHTANLWWTTGGPRVLMTVGEVEEWTWPAGDLIPCRSDMDVEQEISFYDAATGGTEVATWCWKCTKCQDV